MAQPPDNTSSAAAYLCRAIRNDIEHRSRPSGKLPSLRALANQYGLSRMTVQRALQRLLAEGLLERRPPRRGYWVRTSEAISPATDVAGATQRLYRTLRDRILRGDFRPEDTLPLQKSLRHRYRVSRGTVHNALAILAADGLIERTGSRFRIPQSLTADSGARRVHIVHGGGEQSPMRLDPWSLEILAGAEHHIHKSGWAPPRYVSAARAGNDAEAGGIDSGDVAGYIVVQHWRALRPVQTTARANRLPYVVADTADAYDQMASRAFTSDEPAFWICTDNVAAGRAVGTHLRLRGHCRIAFISHLPLDTLRWLNNRLIGLQGCFPESDGRLSIFSHKRPPQSTPGQQRPMIPEIRRMQRFYRQRTEAPLSVTTAVIGDLFDLDSMARAGAEAAPLFDTALARKDITAWVCCNDELGLLARQYLLNRNIRPGADIALAAFDNTLYARANDITSYDFALRDLGYAAVQCLARPRYFPPAAQGPKRIEGELIMRGST
jgi:DNA-binding FadR family transcriptional regulator